MHTWNYRGIRVLNLHNRNPRRTVVWMHRAQRCSALGTIRPSDLVTASLSFDQLPAILEGDVPPGTIKLAVEICS